MVRLEIWLKGWMKKCYLFILSRSTCRQGQWRCTKEPCPGKCQVYGNGHYQTFDYKWYRFDGHCQYTLVEVRSNVKASNILHSKENHPNVLSKLLFLKYRLKFAIFLHTGICFNSAVFTSGWLWTWKWYLLYQSGECTLLWWSSHLLSRHRPRPAGDCFCDLFSLQSSAAHLVMLFTKLFSDSFDPFDPSSVSSMQQS